MNAESRFPLLLACCCLLLVLLQGPAIVASEADLMLNDGTRVTGALIALNDRLRWQTDLATVPLSLPRNRLASITWHRPPADSPSAMLVMSNNDQVPVEQVKSIDDKAVSCVVFGTTLIVPRKNIRSLVWPAAPSAAVWSAEENWKVTVAEEAHPLTGAMEIAYTDDGQLVLPFGSLEAAVELPDDLPDMYFLRALLRYTPPADLTLSVGGIETEEEPLPGLTMTLSPTSCHLGGSASPLKANELEELLVGNRLEVTLALAPAAGLAQLYINRVFVAQARWTPASRELRISSRHPLTLQSLDVLPMVRWPRQTTERQQTTVWMQDGTHLLGEELNLKEGTAHFKSKGLGSVEFVSTALAGFSFPPQEEGLDLLIAPYLAQLANGGRLHLDQVRIADGIINAQHRVLGEVSIPVEQLVLLRGDSFSLAPWLDGMEGP